MLINTGLPRPGPLALCILKAQKRYLEGTEVPTKCLCRHTRMLSTTVAIPCQSLSEILAGDHESIN